MLNIHLQRKRAEDEEAERRRQGKSCFGGTRTGHPAARVHGGECEPYNGLSPQDSVLS